MKIISCTVYLFQALYFVMSEVCALSNVRCALNELEMNKKVQSNYLVKYNYSFILSLSQGLQYVDCNSISNAIAVKLIDA